MKDFYYHINWGGGVFVKDGDFFISQGGLEKPWGKAWKKIKAHDLDHAREIANAKKIENPSAWQIAGVNYR